MKVQAYQIPARDRRKTGSVFNALFTKAMHAMLLLATM